MEKLFGPGDAKDPAYVNIRDLEWNTEIREAAEAMWSEYEPLCPDADFLSKAKEDFSATAWQMHLTVFLKRRGFEMIKAGEEGPDICFMRSEARCWIEAVSANLGQGPDAVPVYNDGFAHPVPEDQIMLRLRSVLHDKLKKHEGWLANGIVKPGEPFMIAVNAGKLGSADLHGGPVTFMEKALLGLHKQTWAIEQGTGKIVDQFYSHRESITKQSGSGVRTDIFLGKECVPLSAVLYSPHHFANNYRMAGNDFTTVYNPNACNPLPVRSFPFGWERWVEDGHVQGRDYRKPV